MIDDRGSDLSCGDETLIAKKTQEPHHGAFPINELRSSVVAFQNLAPPEFVDRTPLKEAVPYAEAISKTVKAQVKPGLVNEIPPCESASPDITKKRKFRYQQSITKIKHNYPNFHISP